MYGMLLESVQHYIQLEYGEDVWQQVLDSAGCRFAVFATHQTYSDTLMYRIAQSCAHVIGSGTADTYMCFFGKCFVRFFSNFGYDEPIKATGRYFSDFLQSVDNIHQQMRFTYPKMLSPSMYITHIDLKGVVLVYRSSRVGFKQYFTGQLHQVAEEFFNIKLEVNILEESSANAGLRNVMVKYRLNFDNLDYIVATSKKKTYLERIPLPDFHCFLLLKLFPFGVIFGQDMKILGAGEKLIVLWGSDCVLGHYVTEYFRLRRPRGIPFTWNNILVLHSVMFELEVVRSRQSYASSAASSPEMPCVRRNSQGVRSVLLKGQMSHIRDINAIVFLCSPLINNLDELPGMGLYLNDLNIHGLSREMVLTGWQHCSRLEMRFEKVKQYCRELENSYTRLDSWKKKGDELLYSMIPQCVADRLRAGESRLRTCEAFENVSILFCELPDLDSSTLKDAMEVVSNMNSIYTCFDSVMDLFDVYKVETVGRVYMAVSGAPHETARHGDNVVDLALCLVRQVRKLHLPPEAAKVRIGIHSGPVVAGVVGLKVPRYCLFGDTVNTAARMQTTSSAGMVHVSSTTHDLLTPGRYRIEPRGTVSVKGKGQMQTYWVTDHRRTKAPAVNCSTVKEESAPAVKEDSTPAVKEESAPAGSFSVEKKESDRAVSRSVVKKKSVPAENRSVGSQSSVKEESESRSSKSRSSVKESIVGLFRLVNKHNKPSRLP